MMRSLYSGVTGLKNHQVRMDVIGNNIANVNTVGFKASRVTFQDIYSQTIRPASATNTQMGGTNPMQVGLGMSVNSIQVMHGPSAAQLTNYGLDLSISGDGFFAVSPTDDGKNLMYTRAGNFTLDAPTGTTGAAASTANLLDANGNYVLGYPASAGGPTSTPTVPTYTPVPGGPAPTKVSIDLSKYKDISIDASGAVQGLCVEVGNPDEGKIVTIAYLCVATFSNPAGLQKQGNNCYTETPNSGAARKYVAGSDLTGSGPLIPGTLEMSNVDLAEQFTDMIVTQRGFQANSRVITTSDQMLEELVNLKR